LVQNQKSHRGNGEVIIHNLLTKINQILDGEYGISQ
jgi:hypothetical protein